MKAILCSKPGDISQLALGEAPNPVLRAGQVRIRVHGSGLNRADIVQRKGHYPPPKGESDIIGLEISGDVAEVDSAVKNFRTGDRVMALLAGGGYAEEVCVDAGLVLPLPAKLSYAEGAAIPEAFLTAHHNLFFLGRVQPGETVLMHAGASGVGTAGIQLLKAIEAKVFVTVGNEQKAAACQNLGARPILYQSEDFSQIIERETSGNGVNVLLDPVGASHWEKSFASLAVGGRWVFIGTMGGKDVSLDIRQMMQRRAQLIGSTLRALPLAEKRQVVRRFQEQFLHLIESGQIKPIMDQVFQAASVQQAHARMEANLNVGKIVLSWD